MEGTAIDTSAPVQPAPVDNSRINFSLPNPMAPIRRAATNTADSLGRARQNTLESLDRGKQNVSNVGQTAFEKASYPLRYAYYSSTNNWKAKVCLFAILVGIIIFIVGFSLEIHNNAHANINFHLEAFGVYSFLLGMYFHNIYRNKDN